MYSQEVIWSSSVDVSKLVLLWSWVELQEGVFHKLINFHDGCFVTASITIVRGGEDGDDVSVVRPVVSIHDKLMGTSNKF